MFRGNPGSVKNKILEDKENIKGEFVAVIDRQASKNQDFDNIDLYSRIDKDGYKIFFDRHRRNST